MRKAKSVNKTYYLITSILVLFLWRVGFSQDTSEINLDKYKIVNNTFTFSSEKYIRIYSKTMNYEEWMDDIWNRYFLRDDGIGLCSFENERLKVAFDTLKTSLNTLVSKPINSEYLEKKLKLTQKSNRQGLIFISEPIIIGGYSFHFLKSKTNKSLFVSKMNSDGIWEYECGVTIYGELH